MNKYFANLALLPAPDNRQIHEMNYSLDEVAVVMAGVNNGPVNINLVYDWCHNSALYYNSSKGSSTICYLGLIKFICVP